MLKKQTLTLIFVSCALTLSAQETVVLPAAPLPAASVDSTPATEAMQHSDTLALPHLTGRGTISRYSLCSPFCLWNDWSLHPGLNASLSLSATVGLGRNSYSGFTQSMAMMYATELAPRLSIAVGGYYSNFNFGPARYHDAGLSAVAGYRFDEHWEAYLFAQKSLVSPTMPSPLYYMSDIGDKIGAEVRYNVNPSFSIGLSVWHQSVPEGRTIGPNPLPSGADYSAPR